MTSVLVLLAVVAGVVVLAIGAGAAGLLQGPAPKLGVREGRLKPPSRTPNSVSSQASLYPDSPQRAYAEIAPFPVRGDATASLARLAQIVAAMPGARIVESKPDYLYAQFTTRVMRFVDDVEFWFSQSDNVIHVRSASRVGRRDFGVNRQRVEAIRARYAAA
jgi:uncharacterized protein (DUF1499 family)